jgi:hypothetical protein
VYLCADVYSTDETILIAGDGSSATVSGPKGDAIGRQCLVGNSE